MTDKYIPDETPENLIPDASQELAFPGVIVDESAVPADDTPMEETSMEESPVEEAPAEEISVEETPIVEETPVVEVPVVETSIEEAPVVDAPIVEAPAAEAILEDIPVEDILAEIPAEETAPAEMFWAEISGDTPIEELEEILFDGNFDPDAFLPDDPEESVPEEIPVAEVPEVTGSSGYMDNYPVLPDTVEKEPENMPAARFDDGGEFDQYFDKETTDRKHTTKERPTRKGRPRRPKGYGMLGIPHILATIIWLMLIVAIGVSLGRMIWVCAADVLAFGREEKIVSISVTTADNLETIAEKLHKAGLVNYPELFLLYADLTDADEKITTGTFTLNTVYDYHALVNQMSPRSGNRVVIEDVLIPEGYNCAQIFALLEQKGICKAADLEAWAANGELDDYWFLEGVERGDKYCLEGYLFPDTYDFYENSTPKLALEKMLDGFEYRYSEELHAKLPELNELLSTMMRKNGKSEEFIAENQFDLHKLLTVASLIEEETASAKESYNIASVIYNRLYNWGSNPPYLNIDAAIFYALGEHKSALTAEDLQVDSPYNTYRYQGLVPGPISNPGLDSISAALDPEDTSYYYYVLNPEAGVHDFSKTLEEHEKKVDKYLRGG